MRKPLTDTTTSSCSSRLAWQVLAAIRAADHTHGPVGQSDCVDRSELVEIGHVFDYEPWLAVVTQQWCQP